MVATNAGGTPEIIDNGINGLLAEIDNPQSMANAILLLYQEREKGKVFGERARQKARVQYTVERFAAEIQEMYESLLHSKLSTRGLSGTKRRYYSSR